MRRSWIAAALALAVALDGCITVSRPNFMQSPAQRDWAATLDLAQRYATSGRFAAADSVLAAFALRNPGTPEASETAYWRAVYALDPSAQTPSLVGPMALLDGYIAGGPPRVHLSEATTLRRMANQLDALSKAAAANAQAAKISESRGEVVARPPDNSADSLEIKRLRDELAKAKEELERIRKRLANPGKPPSPNPK